MTAGSAAQPLDAIFLAVRAALLTTRIPFTSIPSAPSLETVAVSALALDDAFDVNDDWDASVPLIDDPSMLPVLVTAHVVKFYSFIIILADEEKNKISGNVILDADTAEALVSDAAVSVGVLPCDPPRPIFTIAHTGGASINGFRQAGMRMAVDVAKIAAVTLATKLKQ